MLFDIPPLLSVFSTHTTHPATLQAMSDVFTEQGLAAKNISFCGNWGLLNIFGVRKPVFRAFQALHDGGSTRAKIAVTSSSSSVDSLYSVALLGGSGGSSHSKAAGTSSNSEGQFLTVVLANHACPHDCARPPDLNISFTIHGSADVGAGGGGSSMLVLGDVDAGAVTVQRINATSANPKATWEALGAPDYPNPRQIAAIHAASVPSTEHVTAVKTGGNALAVQGILLEAYSVVILKVPIHYL